MDILFLGTSSGCPTKQRNVTGIAVIPENSKGWYLVDCGEATQHQLLHTSLTVNSLHAVFITHIHGDHCYGLPGLIASAAMLGRKHPLPIIAPQGIEAWLRATIEHTALFLPYELQFIATESLTTWEDQVVEVQAIFLSHRAPSYAYSFTEANLEGSLNQEKLLCDQIPKGPLWGRLQKGEDVIHEGKTIRSADYRQPPKLIRKMVIGGDNDQPGLLKAACEQAQVLVHEATYTLDIAEKVGESVQHSSAAIVADFAQSIDLPNLVLTHFSGRYQADVQQSPSIADIQNEAAARYRGALFMAEDFARYRLAKSGAFSRINEPFMVGEKK